MMWVGYNYKEEWNQTSLEVGVTYSGRERYWALKNYPPTYTFLTCVEMIRLDFNLICLFRFNWDPNRNLWLLDQHVVSLLQL